MRLNLTTLLSFRVIIASFHHCSSLPALQTIYFCPSHELWGGLVVSILTILVLKDFIGNHIFLFSLLAEGLPDRRIS